MKGGGWAMRLSTIFSLLLVAVTGFATFGVKYEVEGLLAELARLKSELAADHNQIRVLRAEWNYLNRPGTLAALNQRFLSLQPVTAGQLRTSIADIPMRATQRPVAVASATSALEPVNAVRTLAPGEAAEVSVKNVVELKRSASVKTIGDLIASLSAAH
jgi:hypothetical protein